MTTLSVLIGNSDNKLTQREWSEYIHDVADLIIDLDYQVHFRGYSDPAEPWQNACWVLEADDGFAVLVDRLKKIAWAYHQDSIAVVQGETHFVKASDA